jgi:ATP-dependent Clp protease ATP-binding subunit ClpC
MRSPTFSLSATDAHIGAVLGKCCFSLVSLLGYGVILASLMHFALLRNDMWILYVGALLITGTLFVLWLFIRQELLGDTLVASDETNLAEHLSGELLRALLTIGGDPADHLIIAAARSPRGAFLLREMGIDTATFLRRFEVEAHAPVDLLTFLPYARTLATEIDDYRIDGSTVLGVFFQTDPHAQQLVNELDLSQNDIRNVLRWERFHMDWERESRRFSPQAIVRSVGTVGRKWVLGYTQELDGFTTDVSEEVRSHPIEVVIHQQEIKDVLHVLARSERKNALVLGKPGVGKRTLVWNLARVLRAHELEHSRRFTRMVLLHTEQLLAGAEHPETLLLKALTRASKAGKFILVIDNLALMANATHTDALGVLTRFMHNPNVSLIALADAQEYHTLVKHNPALEQLFEKILLDDASIDDTMAVLMVQSFAVLHRTGTALSYRALRQIMELCTRYISREGFPGKAMAVLDDAVQTARRRGSTVVQEEDVRAVVSLHAHIDVTAASQEERDRLLALESQIQRHIIGQNDAIVALVNALKRARMDVGDPNRPLGTFLFLGPTGVGKTETAKALATEYFGSEDAMIRLDMNEFSTAESVRLLIGSPEAGEQISEGHLARRVQDKPFSVVLLDEIEKAHQSVLNVFLQILDEGHLIDSVGIKTDFRNTIIIATSNAGALFVRDFVAKQSNAPLQQTSFKKLLIDTILREKIFTPEFVNRFDEVILYRPLSLPDAKRVALLMLDSIVHELSERRGIRLQIEEPAVDAIVERGYSAEFGAREMRRAIVDTVETYLANTMLRTDVKRGDTIVIHRSDLQA